LKTAIKIESGDARQLVKGLEKNSIDAVYFDPPFNTGRKFRLVPNSNLGFDDIHPTDQEYIDLLEPILSESKNYLKKNGSFFFHISAEEMMIPHMLCTKHFKKVQPIFWNRSRSKNNVKNKLGAVVDMLFWCSNVDKPKFNLVYQPLDPYYAANSYKNEDDRGNYALGHIVYSRTQATENKDRHYTYTVNGRSWKPEYGWRLDKADLDALVGEGRVHFPKTEKGNLYRKIYMHESKGKPCTNLWDDLHSIAMGSELRKYPTQKPISLLHRIIEMSTNEGDIILDPMAGSGTTALAARPLNRDCILFENNSDAVDIINQNIKAFFER
jgi:site-specific DNA-methyltransferase (adenine-specific)